MKPKILIYIVTYNHEEFIINTLKRIPKLLNYKYKIEILISDDKSQDKTLQVINNNKKKIQKNFKLNIIFNKKNDNDIM